MLASAPPIRNCEMQLRELREYSPVVVGRTAGNTSIPDSAERRPAAQRWTGSWPMPRSGSSTALPCGKSTVLGARCYTSISSIEREPTSHLYWCRLNRRLVMRVVVPMRKLHKVRRVGGSHHAERILAVNGTAVADCAPLPAGRTWTLLNELLEAGYTKTFLAKQLGSCAKRPSLQIPADRITPDSAWLPSTQAMQTTPPGARVCARTLTSLGRRHMPPCRR